MEDRRLRLIVKEADAVLLNVISAVASQLSGILADNNKTAKKNLFSPVEDSFRKPNGVAKGISSTFAFSY